MTTKAPGVTALVTHRGFNICHYAGAPEAEAREGLLRLSRLLNVAPGSIIVPTQTHSCRVAAPEEDLDGVDALVTDKRGVALCINTADCLPLLLADPVAGVIGAAHCGWRGTVAGIAGKTVDRMVDLGASPGRIVAAMGPCICPDCFEVGPEVAELFPPQCVIRKPGEKARVDLASAVRLQLLSRGVNAEAIEQPIDCSMHSVRFYSVRRQGRTLDKRTLSLIMLNPCSLPDWAFSMNCAVTVCDADCRIIYMNQKSRDTFANRGGADLIGHNLMDYHNPRSREIINRLLQTGGTNAYTIEKQGVRKMIYQTAWRLPDGTVGGLAEISMEIPPELPHYVR